MSNKAFYTNVVTIGNNICYRGVDENGTRISRKVQYQPTLYVRSKKDEEFYDLDGLPVGEIQPGSIRETRDWIKQYEEVDNFEIFGQTNFENAYISDHFFDQKLHKIFNKNKILVGRIDLEVGKENNGFPDPVQALEPITAITYRVGKETFVFAYGEYQVQGSEIYIKCADEQELIERFVQCWSEDYPDVVTGWNIKSFDIPYLVNRIIRLCGEKTAKRLSPWGHVYPKDENFYTQNFQSYIISGIARLDYMQLFRKFHKDGASQESYSLDNICSVILGEKKLDYSEYDNIFDLYKKNHQKFIEYNIRDVDLIDKLEKKCKLLELSMLLAYQAKVNYEDVLHQTRMWDSLAYNHLRNKNIVIPQKKHTIKDRPYEGAFVKDPIVGMHHWGVSFDLTSLYPSLMIGFNISPDTFLRMEQALDIERIIRREYLSLTPSLKSENVTMCPNGAIFTREKQGFLGEILEEILETRKQAKKEMLAYEQEKENCRDGKRIKELEELIDSLNNLQSTQKICMNSCYGAVGNQYFRFFDVRQAEAVTISGQLAVMWIMTRLNEYLNKVLGTKDKDYVIAADTDSNYISLNGVVTQIFGDAQNDPKRTVEIINFMDKLCKDKIAPYIDKCFRELEAMLNTYKHTLDMKREALFDKGFWTAKKRYALNVHDSEGVRFEKPQIKITGLETKKTASVPKYSRLKIKEAISIILNGNNDQLIEFIDKTREEFKNLPVEDMAFPRGVNGLAEYGVSVGLGSSAQVYKKGTPIHTKGSLIYNNLIRQKNLSNKYELIQEGGKIKFTYLREPNPYGASVIAFPVRLPKELGLEKYIDYDIMFDKTFLEPVKKYAEVVGWQTEFTNALDI